MIALLANVRFESPFWLLLLVLVPVVWFWPRHGLGRGVAQDRVHRAIRSVLLLLLILALSTPLRLRMDETEHHVLVVDASASTSSTSMETLQSRVRELRSALPGTAVASLLVVGGRGSEGKSLPASSWGKGFSGLRILRDSTHGSSPLGSALELAASTLPMGSRSAITVFTDGLSTDTDWGRALLHCERRGIRVHTVALRQPSNDIRPVAFEATELLRVGQTARFLVDVVGGKGRVRVHVAKDGKRIASSAARILEGRLRVPIEFEASEAGFVRLTAQVEVLEGLDSVASDNRLERPFAIQEPLRILYLGERVQGAQKKLEGLLGRGFALMSPEKGGDRVPEPQDYDLVWLDDVSAKSLPARLLVKIAAAVRDQGLGLCMSGGSAAFGPGGYSDTPIESVLPVDLVQKEEKKDPSTSLAIIIDTSGSMGGNRIVLAKEVTRLALKRLLPHDKVGIVEFYGNKRWAAPLQSAANAIDIQRALNRLDAGGGTILFPAIEEAYFGLRNVQTRYKHVLVLTDAGVESGPYESLLRRMARDGICVSTVLVGPGRHSEFLVELADWGNGRFYNASDRFNLPEVMLKQPSSSRLPAYREGRQKVESRGGPGWWGPRGKQKLPDVLGYVESRLRKGAEALIRTEKERHPVLASWRFGLGRVTTLMTEAVGHGSAEWKDWKGYGSFFGRVLSRTAIDGGLPFRFRIERIGRQAVVVAERLDGSDRKPRAKLRGEDRELRFLEIAPGLFEGRLDFDANRPLLLTAGVMGETGRELRLCAAAPADPRNERNTDPLRALPLGRVAAASGGVSRSLEGLEGFVPTPSDSQAGKRATVLTPLLLLLALLLYLLDLIWRRTSPRRRASTGKQL